MAKWTQTPKRDRADRIIQLRANALSAYEREWKEAKAQQNSDKGANQRALHAVLENYIRCCPDVRAALVKAFPKSNTHGALEDILQSVRPALGLEMLPFSVVPVAQGRAAMVEYIVWREFPDSVDSDLIRSTLADAISSIGMKSPELVVDLKRSAFEWNRLLG
jgi:hypothetical protein